jgi:tetratricopeptide (TPR) repeat protein
MAQGTRVTAGFSVIVLVLGAAFLAPAPSAAAPPLPEEAAREKRIANLLGIVEARPTDVGSWHDLAGLYREAGRFDEAIAAESRAIAGHPKYAYAYWGRGRAKMEKRDYAAARADFTFAAGLWESRHGFEWFVKEERAKDEHVFSYRDRGVCFGHEGKWTEAVADLSRALGMRPDDATFLYERGHLEERGGKKEEAAIDFRRAGLIHAEARNGGAARECEDRLRKLGANPSADEIEAKLKPAPRGSSLP